MIVTMKKFRTLYLILFISIMSVTFSGCSWIPFWGDDEEEEIELESELAEFEEGSPSEVDDLRAEIQALQSEQEDAQLKMEELEDTISSLTPRIAEIDELKKEIADKEGMGGTDSAEMEMMKDTIHKLEFEIEDLKDSMNEMSFEAKLRTAPKRVSRGSSKGGYDKALRLFNIRQYRESLRAFKSLDNRRTSRDLRDNVVFWIGQCYLKMEDYDKAVEQFNIVVEDYRGGNKVVDSLYSMGSAYNELGEKSKALDSLERALSIGPSGDLKRKIQKKIREIEG